MKIPCKQCPVLPICINKDILSCKKLTYYMRDSSNGAEVVDMFSCELIEFSYMSNNIRFIRSEDEASEIRAMSKKSKDFRKEFKFDNYKF